MKQEGGGGKNAPIIFFFKYLQNKKRYDFALLWPLVITYFERFCQISRENFDCLTSYCDFVTGVPKNSKKIFLKKKFVFETTFFAKYFKYISLEKTKYEKCQPPPPLFRRPAPAPYFHSLFLIFQIPLLQGR